MFVPKYSTSLYCSRECYTKSLQHKKNTPNYRTIAEIEAEWLPERERLIAAGILVEGLTPDGPATVLKRKRKLLEM